MKYVFAFLIHCLLLFSLAHSSAGNELGFKEWVTGYYKDTKHCSSSSVSQTSYRHQTFFVELDIEPSWQQSLSKVSATVQANWFSIHCPYLLTPRWNQLASSYDVVLQASLSTEEEFRFSCRDFQNKQW